MKPSVRITKLVWNGRRHRVDGLGGAVSASWCVRCPARLARAKESIRLLLIAQCGLHRLACSLVICRVFPPSCVTAAPHVCSPLTFLCPLRRFMVVFEGRRCPSIITPWLTRTCSPSASAPPSCHGFTSGPQSPSLRCALFPSLPVSTYGSGQYGGLAGTTPLSSQAWYE